MLSVVCATVFANLTTIVLVLAGAMVNLVMGQIKRDGEEAVPRLFDLGTALYMNDYLRESLKIVFVILIFDQKLFHAICYSLFTVKDFSVVVLGKTN